MSDFNLENEKFDGKTPNKPPNSGHNFYYKDKFLERLMIPIRDLEGLTVGFTGRILIESPNRPKYLNSPDSEWFKKSSLWFGLDIAKKAIIKHKKALIVEGNMDVIAAHQLGLPFAVASQGTSFTTFQIQILQRLTKTIWLAFDNDLAGIIAADKFFVLASKMGLQVWQVIIPKNFKDLDEYLRFENRENLETKNLEIKKAESGGEISKKLENLEIITEIEYENQNKDQNENEKNNSWQNSKLNSPFELKVLPYLDFSLAKLENFQALNIYEQEEKLNKFLNLTLGSQGILLEQTLLKLSKITQIKIQTLQEMQEKLKIQNQKLFENKSELDPKIIEQLKPKVVKTPNPPLNIAWQKLTSFYIAKKLDLSLVEKMESIFILLKVFLPNLEQFDDFSDFIINKKDELEIIFQEQMKIIFQDEVRIEDLIKQNFDNIQYYFNQNTEKIFSDQKLIKHHKIVQTVNRKI